jgi:hypothetical protein
MFTSNIVILQGSRIFEQALSDIQGLEENE